MKTLSAQATVARRRRWTELVYLLELTLWQDKFGPSPVSRVLRVSDAPRTELSQEWVPLVVNWGNLSDALNPSDPDVTVGSLDVTLANNYPLAGRARFSDLIRHGLNNDATTYDLLYGDAVLRLLFRGGVSGDDVKLYRFLLEEVRNLSADTLTLRMSGIELSLEDSEDLYRVTTGDFPTADPEAVNQPVPIPLGSQKNQPTLPLIAGLTDILRTDMTDASPANGGSLPLSDAGIVGRFPGTGTVQIDGEKITYTGRNTSILAPALTGITRGVASTAKATHAKGAHVFQVLTEYVYTVGENRGGHQVKAIPAVRSNGLLVDPASYTVELANTTLKPGRSFAVLKFPVKPVISNQVKLVVQDTIAVVDTIGVDDALTVSDNIAIGVTQPSLDTQEYTTSSTPRSSYGNFMPPVSTPSTTVNFTAPSGTYTQCWLVISAKAVYLDGNGSIVPPNNANAEIWPYINWNGTKYLANGGTTTLYLGTGTFFTSVGVGVASPDNQYNTGCRIRLTVDSAMQHLRRTLSTTKSGSAKRTGSVGKFGSASKTGTVIVQGNSSADTVLGAITADVDGLQDDATGTISGTPNGFLEVPHDHTKLLLREVYNETDPALYDAASWSAARAAQAQEGYRWGWAFTGGSFQEWRRQVGFQGRAELYQEGGLWKYTYREQSPVRHRFDDRNLAADVVVDWSPRTEVVTSLDVAFDPSVDYGFQQTVTFQSDLSLARYGVRRGRRDLQGRAGRSLDLPWVRDAATATRLGTYWLSQWQTERLRPRLRAFWDAIHLDKTDCVEIVSPLLDHYGPTRFAIRRKSYDLEAGLLNLELEEADLPPLEQVFGGTYRLKDPNDQPLGAQVQIWRTFAKTLAGMAGVRVSPAQSLLALYRFADQYAEVFIPVQVRLWLKGQAVTLSATVRFRGTATTTRAAKFALRQARSATLAGGYSLSGSVMNILRTATYRFAGPSLTLTRSGRYALIFTRTVPLPGLYRTKTVGSVGRTGLYRVTRPSGPTQAGRYTLQRPLARTLGAQYAIPPTIVLSATYVLKITTTWDTDGTWDTGLRWDP